ncbi:MAG: FAD-dependent oxidoreductase [Rhizobiaceae bacterium]|nr:FAD-dependent oxidoreductase [Rhizobiaceae bacterium]
MTERHVDVVVVGAGLSGSYAALLLREAGLSVALAEARDRVGGLTYSPHSHAYGGRVDLGGQWVSPRHQRINRLIARYAVPLVKQFVTGQRACLHGTDTFFGPMGTVPGLSEQEQAEYKQSYAALYAAMDAVADAPWDSADAERLDSMTYASWVDTICGAGRVRGAMMRIPGAYYGALPEEISALELLRKLKSCGGPVFMSDTDTGGQSWHMMGSAMVSEGMAADLGDAVSLSSPVRRIEWSAGRAKVHADGGVWTCRRVVLAISPAMIAQIRFDPPLPPRRRLLNQRFPNGRNPMSVIVYDRPFWRERGLNGNIIATVGSMTAAFDLGDEHSEKGILITLFTGRAAYGVDDLSPPERRQVVLSKLAQALGPEALEPAEFMEKVWADEEWSAGASSPFLMPGALTTIRGDLREPVGPLHWAGTHMSREYRGYMEGALSAGEDAATRILEGIRT